MTPVRYLLADGAVTAGIAVQLLVLLQLETLVEGLSAHLAHGADLAGVLAHVIQQVLLLSKYIAAGIALVLDPPCVDRNMLLETVEPRELPGADGAPEVERIELYYGNRSNCHLTSQINLNIYNHCVRGL